MADATPKFPALSAGEHDKVMTIALIQASARLQCGVSLEQDAAASGLSETAQAYAKEMGVVFTTEASNG